MPHSIRNLFLVLLFSPSPDHLFFLRNAAKHANLHSLHQPTVSGQFAPGKVSIVRDSAVVAVSTAAGLRLFEAAVTCEDMVNLTLC
jgi:hypothetical protein